ncbi:MAG: hypothetical protein A4S17_00070 [Proteobacteria bacterium HN_bin10]|nr:MAG: hypothetical protein A4S17_00070 [Proteobacteria bacterium HN_bin10]
MKRLTLLTWALAVSFLSVGVALPTVVCTADAQQPTKKGEPQTKAQASQKGETQSKASQSVQPEVDKQTADAATEKRKKLLAEATTALDESKKALKALDENKPDRALAALAAVTGKLEVIVAREPALALAPVDVQVVTEDVLASPETIKTTIEKAKEYLDDGDIQKARPLVASLSSEIQYRIINIPLATYPDAIKAITPLIDDGKIKEAKTALQAALNTLVITTEVVQLPKLRTEQLLKHAQELAEKQDRNSTENTELADILHAARKQLERGEVLGYGNKEAYQPLYEQLDELEKKSSGGKSGKGWFDRIKKQLSELF